MAINSYRRFTDRTGITIYPWVGGGSLPFRGGINPENIVATIEELKGVASVTVQGAFRYDYPLEDVKKSIALLNSEIPRNFDRWDKISSEEMRYLKNFNTQSAAYFRSTIETIAPFVNNLASKLPSHRERVQHVGLFGYSRGDGKIKLPRAIKFTGSLYSVGVPPELIGSGRALKLAEELGLTPLIKRLLPHLKSDFIHVGHYLNRENLDHLCTQNDIWKTVRDEIQYIENFIGESIGPSKPHHILHRNYSSNIYQRLQMQEDFTEDILKAAQIRKSLG